MIRLIVVSLFILLSCCTGNFPPIPVPTPPVPTPTPVPPPVIPEPQCGPGVHHSCWHQPPEASVPLYACPVLNDSGQVVGVINVTDGPTGCPPTPVPPGSETNCDGAPGANTGQKLGSFGDAVNTAMAKKSGCPIGSDCNLGNKTNQTWFREIIAELRSQGICTGQHEVNVTDEIAVSANRTNVRESYHIFGGDDGPGPVPVGGTIRKVVWSPGAIREAYAAGTSPVPTPTPTPSPVGSCTNPLPPKVWTAATLPDGWGQDEIGKPRWQINCGPHQRVIDCTAKVAPRACEYCDSIGMGEMGGQISCGCPVRNECPGVKCEERVACEAYLTGGTKLEARNGASCSFVGSNPFQFAPSNGNCRLCSVGDPRVCGGWF